MKKLAQIMAAVLLVLFAVSCTTHTHVVGNGSDEGNQIVERQWYALWGLVPISGEVDSNEMAAGDTDYTITTEFQPIDVIINFFVQGLTIQRRTVVVTR